MSEQFKVGEVVIFQIDPAVTLESELPDLGRLDGEEVVITGRLGYRHGIDRVIYSYEVHHSLYGTILAEPHELRRRQPPTTGEQMIRAMFDAPPQPQPVPEVA
jgi:hypothetical protein